MIPSINSSENTAFKGKIKIISNKAYSRWHYMKFLKAEDELYKSTEELEQHIESWSILVPVKAAKSIKDFGKMLYEKLASVYYYSKK